MLLVPSILPLVGSVGVVEGEDLISPFEKCFGELFELEEWMVLVDLDEGSEGLVGLFGLFCEVDALEVLQHPPGRFQFGPAGALRPEGFDPVVYEMVEPGELEVAAAEHFGFEGGSRPVRADPLDASSHAGGRYPSVQRHDSKLAVALITLPPKIRHRF